MTTYEPSEVGPEIDSGSKIVIVIDDFAPTFLSLPVRRFVAHAAGLRSLYNFFIDSAHIKRIAFFELPVLSSKAHFTRAIFSIEDWLSKHDYQNLEKYILVDCYYGEGSLSDESDLVGPDLVTRWIETSNLSNLKFGLLSVRGSPIEIYDREGERIPLFRKAEIDDWIESEERLPPKLSEWLGISSGSGPFTFNWSDNSLIASSGKSFSLPAWIYLVFRSFFESERDSQGRKYKVASKDVPYGEVATAYYIGKLTSDQLPQNEVRRKFKQKYEATPDFDVKYAQAFARDIRRFTRDSLGLDLGRAALIASVRGYGYRLGDDWGTPPVIYQSEAPLIRTHNIDGS